MERMHRVTRAVGLILISTSCFSGMQAPAQAASSRQATPAAEPLVLYSAQGYDSTMAKAYTKTGAANVSLVDDSTGNILARISAEKNNPHWDVVWFDGDGAMRGLAQQ